MSNESSRVLDEALALPADERARIAASLIESLDEETDRDVEDRWREVVRRRMQELDEGKVAAVDWQEARKAIFGK